MLRSKIHKAITLMVLD